MEEPRWIKRFENYRKALATLKKGSLKEEEKLTDLEKDGLVQRFEYTFELAWKTMQDYLLNIGYNGLKGPRNVIKQMGQDDMLDIFAWGEMIEARNELTHIYDEDKSRIYIDKIRNDFLVALLNFEKIMSGL